MNVQTSGVIFVHSSSAALCPHVEWSVESVLGHSLTFDWQNQPAEPGTWRCEVTWRGPVGLSAALTSALRACQKIRFEVTEDSSTQAGGQRYAFTPSLGIFHATTDEVGNITVGEQRLREAMRIASEHSKDLSDLLDDLLGQPWDDELEAFRYCDAPVRWLHTGS